MKEIVTIQVGGSGNHVARDYWHRQREYYDGSGKKVQPAGREVLFRGREGRDEPRTLIFDCHGGLDVATSSNRLSLGGEGKFDTTLWSANPELVLPTTTTETIESWADQDTTVYHPHSALPLPVRVPPPSFLSGQTLADTYEKENETIDNQLRFFVEECDSLQGFQFFTDLHTGFAGFTSRYLEKLRDEYPKLPLFQWVAPPINTTDQFDLNLALSARQSSRFEAHLFPWHSFDHVPSTHRHDPYSLLALAVDCGLSSARVDRSLSSISHALAASGPTYLHHLLLADPDSLPTTTPPPENGRVLSEFVTTWGNPSSPSPPSAASAHYPLHPLPWSTPSLLTSLRTTTIPTATHLHHLTSLAPTWSHQPPNSLTDHPTDHLDLLDGLQHDLMDLVEYYRDD